MTFVLGTGGIQPLLYNLEDTNNCEIILFLILLVFVILYNNGFCYDIVIHYFVPVHIFFEIRSFIAQTGLKLPDS